MSSIILIDDCADNFIGDFVNLFILTVKFLDMRKSRIYFNFPRPENG